jgi:hypothetical protein
MLKGASVGPLVIGIVFITQAETRLIGILGFLAAAALSGWEWHRRNRAGKAATSAGDHGPGTTGRDSTPTQRRTTMAASRRQRGRRTMLNRIRAALGRMWRPRRRRTAEHGFYDQRAGGRYRSQQDIEAARGESYGNPPPISGGF